MVPLKALLALMAMVAMFEIAAGTTYTVGKPNGSWDLQTDYTKWVSDKTFHVGDSLLFSYTSSHDVWEVTKESFVSCSKGSNIMTYSGGSTTIALTAPGSRYFICSIASHCVNGMKINITVVSSSEPSNSPPQTSSPILAPPPPSGVAKMSNIGVPATIAIVFGAILY